MKFNVTEVQNYLKASRRYCCVWISQYTI